MIINLNQYKDILSKDIFKYIYLNYPEYIPKPTGIYFKDWDNWSKVVQKVFPLYCIDNNINHIIY